MTHNTSLLLITLIAVLGLIVLVARFKLNAFLALLLASMFVGLASGMKLADIGKGFQEGAGTTLGFIAVVVGLGTMLGKMLSESGGAEVIAETFVRAAGEKRIHWALMLGAFVVGVPVFFGVGVVILIPVVFTIAREAKLPLLYLGIPVVAGLSVSHGLVPPHPGPLIAIEKLGADTGKTIFYSILVGLPAAIIAGPLFGKFISRRVTVEPGGIGRQLSKSSLREKRPRFAVALVTILLPVLLMLSATVADLSLLKSDRFRVWADFAGSPLFAMLVAVLFSFWSFGTSCGFDRAQILRFTEDCVGPAASILLIVGAGGGFSKVLNYAGVDEAMAASVKTWNISPLLLGWLIAAAIRIAVGSATVAITMASAIMAPVAAAAPGTKPELLVIALGAGSLIASHLNDGGFWFVKEYFNMTVPQTLKTWTVMETIISVVALVLVLLLGALTSSPNTLWGLLRLP